MGRFCLFLARSKAHRLYFSKNSVLKPGIQSLSMTFGARISQTWFPEVTQAPHRLKTNVICIVLDREAPTIPTVTALGIPRSPDQKIRQSSLQNFSSPISNRSNRPVGQVQCEPAFKKPLSITVGTHSGPFISSQLPNSCQRGEKPDSITIYETDNRARPEGVGGETVLIFN